MKLLCLVFIVVLTRDTRRGQPLMRLPFNLINPINQKYIKMKHDNEKRDKIYDAIPAQLMVKSYQYGRTIEITDAPTTKQVIKVLPNHRYVDLRSGQVKQMKKRAQTRSDNFKSIKATMARLRRLIGANFLGGKSELWVTLTYAEPITDTKIVYRDFKVFMQRIRKLSFGRQIEYLAVLEPQASGTWHLHVLFKRIDGKQLYIDNKEMAQLWRHGFTKTKRLKQIDNVAAYLMAYLTDLEVSESEGLSKVDNKKIVKGARLCLYPSHTKLYRFSKGIEQPIVKRDFKNNILKANSIDHDADKRYKRHYQHDQTELTITTEFYNKRAKRKEEPGHESHDELPGSL